MAGGRGEAKPYRVFETEEDFQAAVESYIGERVAKLQRAIRRAEERATAAEEEMVELRRELHSGGTLLHSHEDGF